MSDKISPDSVQTAQELWGREADEGVRYGKGFHWVESPLIMAHVNEQVTGSRDTDWATYIYHEYLGDKNTSTKKILSLGCGGGSLERHLCSLGFRGQIDACDFSQGAIEHARALAAEHKMGNISYFVSDLNVADFPPDTYDAVLSGSALHHISNLERLLNQLRQALTEHGLLIINEYVGPFKFQWLPKQTKIVDELLHILPQKYQKRASAPGEYKNAFGGPPSIREMDAIDPTESVRSDEIILLIKARFSIREQKGFGGTLLQMLLQDIIGNFDPKEPLDAGFLNLLIYIEKLLIRENVLGSDFVSLIAEKKVNLCAQDLSEEYPTDLKSELKARDLRILNLQEQVRQSSERARDVEARLHELGNIRISAHEIDESAGWRLLQLFRKWKECRFPPGSRRRRFYDTISRQVQKRLTSHP